MCGRNVVKLALASAILFASGVTVEAQTQTPAHLTADGVTLPMTRASNVLQATPEPRIAAT